MNEIEALVKMRKYVKQLESLAPYLSTERDLPSPQAAALRTRALASLEKDLSTEKALLHVLKSGVTWEAVFQDAKACCEQARASHAAVPHASFTLKAAFLPESMHELRDQRNELLLITQRAARKAHGLSCHLASGAAAGAASVVVDDLRVMYSHRWFGSLRRSVPGAHAYWSAAVSTPSKRAFPPHRLSTCGMCIACGQRVPHAVRNNAVSSSTLRSIHAPVMQGLTLKQYLQFCRASRPFLRDCDREPVHDNRQKHSGRNNDEDSDDSVSVTSVISSEFNAGCGGALQPVLTLSAMPALCTQVDKDNAFLLYAHTMFGLPRSRSFLLLKGESQSDRHRNRHRIQPASSVDFDTGACCNDTAHGWSHVFFRQSAGTKPIVKRNAVQQHKRLRPSRSDDTSSADTSSDSDEDSTSSSLFE